MNSKWGICLNLKNSPFINLVRQTKRLCLLTEKRGESNQVSNNTKKFEYRNNPWISMPTLLLQMKRRLTTLLKTTLPISALPLLFAVICYSVENAALKTAHLLCYLYQEDHEEILNRSKHQKITYCASQDSSLLVSSAALLKNFFIDVYGNYTCFLITMMLLNSMSKMLVFGLGCTATTTELSLTSSGTSARRRLEHILVQPLKRFKDIHCKSDISMLTLFKKLTVSVLSMAVQYSFVYYIYMIFYAASYYFCCMLFSGFGTTDGRIETLFKEQRMQEKGDGAEMLINLESFNMIRQQTQRILQASNTNDVIWTLGSIILEECYYKYSIVQVNSTQVLLFCDGGILRIDVSDTLPKVVGISPFNLSVYWTTFILAPNGRFALTKTIYTDKYNISDLLQPQNGIQLNLSLGYSTSQTFCSNSQNGYLFTSNTLYQFDIYSTEVRKITTDNQRVPDSDIQATNDCDTVFYIIMTDDGTVYLQVITGLMNENQVKIMLSLEISTPYKLVLSHNEKTLFVIGIERLTIIDVSVLTSPAIISSSLLNSLNSYNDQAILSPDDSTLILVSSLISTVIVDLSDLRNPIVFKSSMIFQDTLFAFSFDSKYLFLIDTNTFLVNTLYVNIKVEQFGLSYVSLNFKTQKTITDTTIYGLAMSSDNKTVLTCYGNQLGNFSLLDRTYNQLAQNNITDLCQIVPSKRNGTNFVIVTAGIYTSNGTLLFNMVDVIFLYCVFYQDENILICTYSTYSEGGVFALNITNSEESQITHHGGGLLNQITYIKDILIVGHFNNLKVYNVSQIFSSVLLCETDMYRGFVIQSLSLSPDMQTLVVKVIDFVNLAEYLVIFDTSNAAKIRFTSQMLLGGTYYNNFYTSDDIAFINSNILTCLYNSSALIVDVSQKYSPYITTIIPILPFQSSLTHLPTSSGFPLIIAEHSGLLQTIDLNDQYIIDIVNITVGRGEIYSHKMTVLRKNSIGKYSLIDQNYLFIAASLYDVNLRGVDLFSVYPVLANWISFDKTDGILRVLPTSQEAIQSYSVYFVLATQSKQEEFDVISSIDSEDLVRELVSSGYLDKDLYVTEDFDLSKKLYLSHAFKQNETIIRSILADHTFGILKRINVISSLKRQLNSSTLSLTTASLFPLDIRLLLLGTYCQFVSRSISIATPSFLNNFTTLTLQGLLFNINQIFASLVINLQDDETPCDGILIIEDSLNPTYNETIYNISKLFRKNQAPRIKNNSWLQQGINSVHLETGTYFSIIIDKTSFTEDDLTFSLLSIELASWLSLSDFTLSGIVPTVSLYRLLPKTYYIHIRAANQYKWMDFTLKLEVTPSIGDILKVLAQIIGVIGLYSYFKVFLNIVSQKLYKDPYPWLLKAGDKVTLEKIFPVAFIAQELAESKKILKKMRNVFAKKLNHRSINNNKLAMCFLDPITNQIDVKKLAKMIKGTSKSLSKPELSLVGLKNVARSDSRRDLIQQLIVNELVMRQLHVTRNKLTKQVFNMLKNKWRSLIQKDNLNLWQLSVNDAKLDYELDTNGVYNACIQPTGGSRKAVPGLNALFSRKLAKQDSRSKPETLKTPAEITITKLNLQNNKQSDLKIADSAQMASPGSSRFPNINLTLLGRALVAHAFKQHHVKTTAKDVQILSNHVVHGPNFLPQSVNQFLKLDLHLLEFNRGNNTDCGVKYRIINDVLEFYGVVSEDIKEKTIVVQVMHKKGRILKEITIGNMEAEEEEEEEHLVSLEFSLNNKSLNEEEEKSIFADAEHESPQKKKDEDNNRESASLGLESSPDHQT